MTGRPAPPRKPSVRTDAEAWEIVEQNTQLVHWTVRRMPSIRNEQDHEDACADGILGLFRAAQLYDPTTGYRFSTYALAWIRQAVQKGRGTIEGSGYRRARAKGQDYETPTSLDALHGDITLADYLVSPDRTDIDGERTTVRALAEAQCSDRLDVLILDDMENPSRTLRDLAEEAGVSAQGVFLRRSRLRQRLLPLADDLLA